MGKLQGTVWSLGEQPGPAKEKRMQLPEPVERHLQEKETTARGDPGRSWGTHTQPPSPPRDPHWLSLGQGTGSLWVSVQVSLQGRRAEQS